MTLFSRFLLTKVVTRYTQSLYSNQKHGTCVKVSLVLPQFRNLSNGYRQNHSLALLPYAKGRSLGHRLLTRSYVLSDIFEEFDEAPVASGSIAQVHRGTLKFQYPGHKVKSSEVAVKVRHPCVEETMTRDFVIIKMAAKLTTFVPGLNWFRLDECVQQFSLYMLSQVDLSREASHLSRFIYNFRGWKDASFPKPVFPLVHPSVLVESFEHGESVARYVDGFEGHEWLKSKVAHIGTNALLKMLLVDNFVHADMHPGNILVRNNGAHYFP
ncbi:hypothetical protein HID58_013583 [Brassica napus]|uniref:ABC1 atypical kinase-like domain-containing protein n=1 Tax=Brassica napus TaxID=3708 RepID=A0ABQ8E4B1_BRANA|nr:hypothetical protein HID58_013583 [Brassica napus]